MTVYFCLLYMYFIAAESLWLMCSIKNCIAIFGLRNSVKWLGQVGSELVWVGSDPEKVTRVQLCVAHVFARLLNPTQPIENVTRSDPTRGTTNVDPTQPNPTTATHSNCKFKVTVTCAWWYFKKTSYNMAGSTVGSTNGWFVFLLTYCINCYCTATHSFIHLRTQHRQKHNVK